ncbi:type IX secretion system membrane protein PorP/SprF [Tenacibaculum sp. IB213877]|uniref:PorP/SprF family type IX secretion system membrane protein n=1 Tax=Tenacibaculum sp. IB213877 TaxID=3097351 RepID=UPI002A5A253A|nr:type IX secretion system membrane protein PorP/SprF [Tenacibaculum sp. IB213877]MDY0779729.1 type IX secretion system membrane protein PorP/SprF [Tenacibaculum sp. IB213877]
MKKIIIVLLLCVGLKITAQERDLPPYINHMADNPFMISPSYAGIGSGLQIRLNGVSQWIGVKDAPNTQSITVEARIADTFGGGLTIFNDQNGYTTQQGVKLSFASHLTLSDLYDSFLSFGMTYTFVQFGVDTRYNNSGQPLSNISEGKSNFDVSMLYRFDRFAISANVNNILDKEVVNSLSGEPEILRKYSIYSLYTFKINREVEFEPSIFFEYFEGSGRSRNDVNVKLRKRINEGYIWGGLSYTFLNDQFGEPISVAPMVGLKKNKFYLSYGVSLNVNNIQDFTYGTHMITLGFDYDRRPSLARCTQKMMMF